MTESTAGLIDVPSEAPQPGAARRTFMLAWGAAALAVVTVFGGGAKLVSLTVLSEGEGPALAQAAVTLADVLFEMSAFPFTIQNVMWLIFGIGLGDLHFRSRTARREEAQLNLKLLPEDEETLLRAQDLQPYYRSIKSGDTGEFFLHKILRRVILQFQSGRSVDQANSLLNSSLELFHHEIELRYNLIRYILWVIPTIGFIGTVVGISFALGSAGDVPEDLTNRDEVKGWMAGLTGDLGVAFNTTLVALVMSAILVLIQHIVQAREEQALNRVGQYCLDNLINRLYEKS